MGGSNDRLRAARKAAGFTSARAAAIRHGWTPSTYSSHENGQTPVPSDEAQKYAKAFKVSPGWILTGEGKGPVKHATRPAGWIGAGAEISPIGEDEPFSEGDEVDLPPGIYEEADIYIVRGDSMFPRYYDGERAIVRRQKLAPQDLLNQECVVKLSDGRMLLKRIRRGSRRHLFNLESYNAELMEDQKVEWAAPVKWRG